MTALLRRLVVSPGRNADLFGAWLLTLIVHPMIPLDHLLARDDLVPWITLCTVAVAWLRARSLGDPPPPGLTLRTVGWARNGTRWGLCISPLALLAWYDTGATGGMGAFYAAAGLTLLVGVLVGAGRAHEQTAWRPPGGGAWQRWTVRVLLPVGGALLLGFLGARVPEWPAGTRWDWLFVGGLLGLQFYTLGMLPDRLRTHRQRRASGRRDGRRYRPPSFRFLLALLGPSGGLAVLLLLHQLLRLPVSFDQGVIVSLHVFAWAAVIWPPQIPIAVSCVLHEVVPSAGRDPEAKGATVAFERPPKGALRLNPLGVRRLRVVHHWLVHVQDPRIEDLDDPIRLLWTREPLPLSYHVLGEASFEPNPVTHMPQWRTITIRFEDQRDVGQLSAGGVQTRRLVVLRPFPSRAPLFGPRATRTYRWDPNLPADTVQVVDATTEQVTLEDGDLIVLSTEGVARAFELEIGMPVYERAELGVGRPPQLEDYVSVS